VPSSAAKAIQDNYLVTWTRFNNVKKLWRMADARAGAVPAWRHMLVTNAGRRFPALEESANTYAPRLVLTTTLVTPPNTTLPAVAAVTLRFVFYSTCAVVSALLLPVNGLWPSLSVSGA